jgi:hypothetical protein
MATVTGCALLAYTCTLVACCGTTSLINMTAFV